MKKICLLVLAILSLNYAFSQKVDVFIYVAGSSGALQLDSVKNTYVPLRFEQNDDTLFLSAGTVRIRGAKTKKEISFEVNPKPLERSTDKDGGFNMIFQAKASNGMTVCVMYFFDANSHLRKLMIGDVTLVRIVSFWDLRYLGKERL